MTEVNEPVRVNKLSRGMAIFLFFLAMVLVVTLAGVVVQNSSLGERSWQTPAVGHSVNGYAGAPVGSSVYQSGS